MKDQRIQQMFDEYADSLPQQNNLALRAKQQMAAKQKRTTTGFFAKLGGFCAAALVCVLCLSLIVNAVFPNGGEQFAPPMSDSQASLPSFYESNQLSTQRVSSSFSSDKFDGTAESLFNFDQVAALSLASGESIANKKFFAYYLQDDELACVATQFMFHCGDGQFVDVTIIVETDGLLCNDWSSLYYNVGSVIETVADNGELVGGSCALPLDGTMRFYVMVQSSDTQLNADICAKLTNIFN